MKVEFKPGYYEWHVIVNGNIFYTFGDIIEDIPHPLTKENLLTTCESFVSLMELDLASKEIEYDAYIPIMLLEAMKKELWDRYGTEEIGG